jgi:hypothetical protein
VASDRVTETTVDVPDSWSSFCGPKDSRVRGRSMSTSAYTNQPTPLFSGSIRACRRWISARERLQFARETGAVYTMLPDHGATAVIVKPRQADEA